MNSDRLHSLLERLNDGDAAAVEELLHVYEPYLRMVVRRRLSPALRRKFDSIDIVQSVWADLFDHLQKADWTFDDDAHLRAFLVKVTQNRFIDRSRQQQKPLALEQQLGPKELDESPQLLPRPSEEAQANDLWNRMLALCPPEHRELLVLKRQGFSLDEIATRTRMHKSSVRRFLYSLARDVVRDPQTADASGERER